MKISVSKNRKILSPCELKNFEYQVDPYIGCGHYCYYCYVLPQAETNWLKEIRLHHDIVARLSKEMERIPPQSINMGYHTDPYQPSEAESYQTRKVLELFLEKGFSASILTKSDLFVRDIDILKEMDDAAVSISVAFNDNQTRRLFEANTEDTEKRVEALRQLKEAGLKTGALICPVIPYITDTEQLIDLLAPCADVIWIYGLSIDNRSSQNWSNVQKILKHEFSALADQIEEAIFSKEHNFWSELRNILKKRKVNRKLNLNIHI